MTNYTEYFEYLDALRESGATNMFGARPFLQEAFALPKVEASTVLSAWMQTFGKGKTTPAERAAMVPDALVKLGLNGGRDA